jgi:hypothetical protein
VIVTTSVRPTDARRGGTVRVVLRWMVTFAGFPLGSVTARAIAGPVDDTLAAAVGGLVNGTVLGAAQWWGAGRRVLAAGPWIAATAVGLMVGLAVGATAVGFATDATALVVQGAICGLVLGAAQAIVLRRPLGPLAAAWPLLLAAVWAAGWAITTSIGVRVDEQFTVFGSSGAIVATAVTVVLPLTLRRRERAA